MNRAEKFIKIVFEKEGFYSNNKSDSGGETIYGIARNTHPNWSGWKIVDEYKKSTSFPNNMKSDLKLISLKDDFYKSIFYNPTKVDLITDELLALHVFDFAVNAGISRSIKTLQKVVGAHIDGAFGKGTLDLVNKGNHVDDFIKARKDFYTLIGVGKNAKFLKGWINRVNNLKV